MIYLALTVRSQKLIGLPKLLFPYVFAYDVSFHSMEVKNALDKRN